MVEAARVGQGVATIPMRSRKSLGSRGKHRRMRWGAEGLRRVWREVAVSLACPGSGAPGPVQELR